MSTPASTLDTPDPTTLLLCAEDAAGLDRTTEELAQWMAGTCASGSPQWPLPEIAVALRGRLRPLSHRRAGYVQSWQDALAALRDKNRWASATVVEGTPKLVVSLPGQGTLRPGVLARLLAQAPQWAAHLARLARLAADASGFDCMAWLGDAHADPDLVLKDNGKTQLAIFCVGVSLARWLGDLGLRPDGYVGHSLGEWIGATLAEVLTEEDAIRAVHHRGRLMQATGPGAALIVRQTAEALQAKLPSDVTLACVNAPNLCLVSGRPEAIARYAENLAAERIVARPAPIHVAVHSPIMDAVIEPFRRELDAVTFRQPRNRLLSTVTGQWMSPAEACDANYWATQLRSTVRFDKAAETLLAEPCAILLEIGIGSALTSLAGSRIKNRASQRAFALFGRDEPPAEGYDLGRPMQTLAELWASGAAIELVGEVPLTRPLCPLWNDSDRR